MYSSVAIFAAAEFSWICIQNFVLLIICKQLQSQRYMVSAMMQILQQDGPLRILPKPQPFTKPNQKNK